MDYWLCLHVGQQLFLVEDKADYRKYSLLRSQRRGPHYEDVIFRSIVYNSADDHSTWAPKDLLRN